ncbi:MAG: hypothetical protein P9M15_03880 [Candidatus Electryoneaceae bacterium]|nr:hypothetical protein [Candidatus Electryoneaceae bacterium]
MKNGQQIARVTHRNGKTGRGVIYHAPDVCFSGYPNCHSEPDPEYTVFYYVFWVPAFAGMTKKETGMTNP